MGNHNHNPPFSISASFISPRRKKLKSSNCLAEFFRCFSDFKLFLNFFLSNTTLVSSLLLLCVLDRYGSLSFFSLLEFHSPSCGWREASALVQAHVHCESNGFGPVRLIVISCSSLKQASFFISSQFSSFLFLILFLSQHRHYELAIVEFEFDQELYFNTAPFLCAGASDACPPLDCVPCDWSSQNVSGLFSSLWFDKREKKGLVPL